MFRIHFSRALLILLALVICTGNIYALGPYATVAPQTLAYVTPGPAVASQSWATVTPSLSNSDAANPRWFQVKSQTQNWFLATPQAGAVTNGVPGTITITVVPGTNGANLYGLTVGDTGNSATFTLQSSTTGSGGWTDDATITVTLKLYNSPFVSASPVPPLTDPTPLNTSGTATVSAVAALGGPIAFSIDALTVPAWLNPVTCTAPNPCTSASTIHFSLVSNVLTILAPGNYPASIGLVTPFAEFYVPIQVVITAGSGSAFYVQDGNGNKLSTTAVTTSVPANALPPITVTLFGNPDPVNMTAISCSVALLAGGDPDPGGTCSVTDVNGNALSTGVAYPMGLQTVVNVSAIDFNQRVGNTVEVTYNFTPAGSGALSYKMDYLLLGGQVSISSVFPTSMKQVASGSNVIVMLTGKNFVGSQNTSGGAIKPTQVWWGDSVAHVSNPPTGANGGLIPATNVSVSGSGTTLYITFPGNTFTSKVGSVVYLGLANQTTTTALASFPTAANGGVTTSFKITAGPVVDSITNAASYEVAVPGTANLAPYELISIFGQAVGGVAGGLIPLADFPNPSSPIVPAVPDPVFGLYPTSIPIGTKGNKVSVSFYTDAAHTQSPIAAPMLFAAPGQINAIVPSSLVVGTQYYVSVDYLTVSTTGAKTSSYSDSFMVTAVAADPGIFTMTGSGRGQGAILLDKADVSAPTGFDAPVLNATTSAATKAAAGDIIQIYLAGLGVPDSTDVDGTNALIAGDNGCIAASTGDPQNPGYLEYVNGLTTPPAVPWTSIDGAVIKSAWVLGTHYAPCLGANTFPVTVTFYDPNDLTKFVTAPAANVLYAGFVADSVAGLYQVNVLIPSLAATTVASGNPILVEVSIGSAASGTVLGTAPLVVTMAH